MAGSGPNTRSHMGHERLHRLTTNGHRKVWSPSMQKVETEHDERKKFLRRADDGLMPQALFDNWVKRSGHHPVAVAKAIEKVYARKAKWLTLFVVVLVSSLLTVISSLGFSGKSTQLWLLGTGFVMILVACIGGLVVTTRPDGEDAFPRQALGFIGHYKELLEWSKESPAALARLNQGGLRKLAEMILVSRASQVLAYKAGDDPSADGFTGNDVTRDYTWAHEVLTALGIANRGYDRYFNLAAKGHT